ncbi:hypothetical protein RvY_15712 [Ramazzottius varieornatus]|uniref:Uncharacterized protein n=1 Tax=Ramazzottius varieornatus TaxID=947166 RepID=A0A1D1VVX3_RAMVA|nr:hypothetical protein RvY_15712 [Ramazzottius varieornatus]
MSMTCYMEVVGAIARQFVNSNKVDDLRRPLPAPRSSRLEGPESVGTSSRRLLLTNEPSHRPQTRIAIYIYPWVMGSTAISK